MIANKDNSSGNETVSELDTFLQLKSAYVQKRMTEIQGILLKLEVLEKKCDLIANEHLMLRQKVIHLSLENLCSKDSTSFKEEIMEEACVKKEWVNIYSYFSYQNLMTLITKKIILLQIV